MKHTEKSYALRHRLGQKLVELALLKQVETGVCALCNRPLDSEHTCCLMQDFLIEDSKDAQLPTEPHSALDIECLITLPQFLDYRKNGSVSDDDGSGHFATATHHASEYLSVSDEPPSWATHVCWYDK